MQFATGLLLALIIAAAAYASRSLSRSGAMAAVVLGTAVYGFGGWQAAIVLLTFFLSSSLIEKLARPSGRKPADKYAKGSRRDAGQVLGNGLVAAIFAALAYLNPLETWPWFGFAGSLAAVNADTWATELGILSHRPPRLITRLNQHVAAGTSGGVSIAGTLAALLGAVLIGALASAVAPIKTANLMVSVSAAGLIGSLVDSILGATVQSMYVCTVEKTETEQHPIHRCGAPTVLVRGWRWLDNDVVNLACGAAGALTACSIAAALALL